jgi:hypothetical protein
VGTDTVQTLIDIFKEEWPVVTGAPWLVMGVCAAVAVVVWWISRQIILGEIAEPKAHLATRDERRQLAEARVASFKIQVAEAQASVGSLQGLIEGGTLPWGLSQLHPVRPPAI